MTIVNTNNHVVCERDEYGHAVRESDSRIQFSAALSRSVKAKQSGPDVPNSEIVSLIRERLEQHPHFRGRAAQFKVEAINGAIVLSGRLPTYYLKQLLQEAVKKIPDVARIDNRVEVTFH